MIKRFDVRPLLLFAHDLIIERRSEMTKISYSFCMQYDAGHKVCYKRTYLSKRSEVQGRLSP